MFGFPIIKPSFSFKNVETITTITLNVSINTTGYDCLQTSCRLDSIKLLLAPNENMANHSIGAGEE